MLKYIQQFCRQLSQKNTSISILFLHVYDKIFDEVYKKV